MKVAPPCVSSFSDDDKAQVQETGKKTPEMLSLNLAARWGGAHHRSMFLRHSLDRPGVIEADTAARSC